MNIFNLIENFGNKEFLDLKTSRRSSFKQFTGFGKDMALAAIPFGMFAAGTKSSFAAASMQNMPTPIQVLNFALTLEYLERDFYQIAVDTPGLIPAEGQVYFNQILQHEADHVDFLIAGITGAGGTPVDQPTFDFTAGGMFNPFGDYAQLLVLSQGFEDTGVRAYKGQAANLRPEVTGDDGALLTAALQIHSVEARHASQIRRLRGQKGWITSDNYDAGVPAAVGDAVYVREDNTVQGGVNLSGMFNNFGGNDAVTEAYDEPLTMDEVNAIASLFIV